MIVVKAALLTPTMLAPKDSFAWAFSQSLSPTFYWRHGMQWPRELTIPLMFSSFITFLLVERNSFFAIQIYVIYSDICRRYARNVDSLQILLLSFHWEWLWSGPVLNERRLPAFHQCHALHSATEIDSRSVLKTMMDSVRRHWVWESLDDRLFKNVKRFVLVRSGFWRISERQITKAEKSESDLTTWLFERKIVKRKANIFIYHSKRTVTHTLELLVKLFEKMLRVLKSPVPLYCPLAPWPHVTILLPCHPACWTPASCHTDGTEKQWVWQTWWLTGPKWILPYTLNLWNNSVINILI